MIMMVGHLQVDGEQPPLETFVGPHEHVPEPYFRCPTTFLQRPHGVADPLQTCHAEVKRSSVIEKDYILILNITFVLVRVFS